MVKKRRGQNLVFFIGLLPIFLMALGLVVDFGRFMILHAQAAAMADSVALSAANALDLHSTPGNWMLDQEYARRRADFIFTSWSINHLPYESWMEIRLDQFIVQANRVKVVVHAECQPIFLGAFGVGPYSIDVASYARAAVGISKEEPW